MQQISMREKSFLSKKAIHRSSFSIFVSCKRLENVQNLLKSSTLDGILSVVGIDSRYNDGCRQFVNYLLFGFYNYDLEQLEVDILEDQLEDLIIFVKRTSVSVYCSTTLSHYLLPFITHWRNLELHCLKHDKLKVLSEDDVEEFKIKSFVAMMDGSVNIGIPYYNGQHYSVHRISCSREFTPNVIEKWPLIQSYALEGVGRGMFFTMQFIVRSVYDEMLVLYNQCDPANLEETLIRSLPLLERHWQEFIDSVAEKHPKNKTKQAALDVTEKAVAEPLISYFNHGRLSFPRKNDEMKTLKPFVCFGSRTQDFEIQSTTNTTLRESGAGGHALHMTFNDRIENLLIEQKMLGELERLRNDDSAQVLVRTRNIVEGDSPKKPLSCCRTYFLSSLNPDTKRDVELLMTLYMKCVKACKKAIQSYCSNWDADHALVIAKKVLSTACSRLCPTARYGSRLDVFDNSGRVRIDHSSFHIKKVTAYIRDIQNSKGEILGSVRFADTFINSSIQTRTSEQPDSKYNTNIIVLTQGIPTVVHWEVGESVPKIESSLLTKLSDAYICSNSHLLDGNPTCDVEFYVDGSMVVFPHHLPAFYFPAFTGLQKYTCYNAKSLDAVPLLQIYPKRENLAEVLRCKNKSTFAIAFYPQTSAWKIFTNVMLPRLEQLTMIFSHSQHLDKSLIDSYNEIQMKYSWQAGLLHHGRVKSRSSALVQATATLQPQLTGFMKHFVASYVLCGKSIPEEDLPMVLEKKVDLTDNVIAVPGGSRKAQDKICVTIICGLPGSHADLLCASLVALHKEKVRWVVVKVQSKHGDATTVDEEHLQSQLAELVSKKKVARPGLAAAKKLRIILEVIGFFDISLVVSCVLNHKDKSVLEQMFIGAVTTCIEPVICSIENFKLFPNVLEQCVPGIANNIAFTGVLEDLKDNHLSSMQSLVRSVNSDAAFLLAATGNVKRNEDFDLILSEDLFGSDQCAALRYLSRPGLWNGTFQSGHSTLKINEVKIVFSQPLLKGTLCARLRALKHAHVPHPYTGNVYMVQGMVAFTEPADKPVASSLCFVSNTGALHIESRETSAKAPAPPTSRNAPATKPYYLKFYGVSLSENTLRDWLRKCGRQAPSKKAHKSRESLGSTDRKKIQHLHQHDALPEGFFYNGAHYCSLADGSKTYEHPLIEKFIDEYLLEENRKIDEYNKQIDAMSLPNLF